jgi:NitT/TauT family transport system ATP-binding protein
MAAINHVSLNEVSHAYREEHEALVTLQDIELGVPRGQFLSVLGPSGCGKSTLLRLIGGLLEPDRGSVAIDAEPPARAQARKSIGFVFQDPALLPWRTVHANVRLPLELNGYRVGNELPNPDDLLALVGLDGFRDYYPHQLSGGMQQRVALARAIIYDPQLLLMDEPFGALDEITRSSLRYELLQVWGSRAPVAGRPTVVFVTHSVPEAVALSDRVVVLSPRPGRIVADVDIELERPRTEEMEQSPAFLDYAAYLRKALRAAA